MDTPNCDEELQEITSKLLDCLQFVPTIQGSHFDIRAMNNIGIYTIGLLQTEFFHIDLLEMDPNIDTYWKISDELVYAIVFRGAVDLRFRKEDVSFKRTLRNKSVEIKNGTPFLFQTNVEKCSILLIGFKNKGVTHE